MPRPPTPPETYVVRHVRVPRKLDMALRRVARDERRKVVEVIVIAIEDWLGGRAVKPRTAPSAPGAGRVKPRTR